MNWLQSLFQHNKAWIVPVVTSAAYAAGSSLQQGKMDPKAVGAAVLVTVGALVKSPLAQNAASDIASGAPIGTATLALAAEQTAAQTIDNAAKP
jgi:hypothetical protein